MHRRSMSTKRSQATRWLLQGLVFRGRSGLIGFEHLPADRGRRLPAVRVATAEATVVTYQPRALGRPPPPSVEEMTTADVLHL